MKAEAKARELHLADIGREAVRDYCARLNPPLVFSVQSPEENGAPSNGNGATPRTDHERATANG